MKVFQPIGLKRYYFAIADFTDGCTVASKVLKHVYGRREQPGMSNSKTATLSNVIASPRKNDDDFDYGHMHFPE